MKRSARTRAPRHRRVAAALAAGCTMGPDYARPPVDAPAAFRFEPKAVAETANTAWWKQFGDPVLDQLIDTALANNLNVKVAAANVEQAAGVFTQTRSGLFPQIGYSGLGERARTSESGATRLPDLVPNPQNAYQAAAHRELGDRSLGPHPAPERIGARQPASRPTRPGAA